MRYAVETIGRLGHSSSCHCHGQRRMGMGGLLDTLNEIGDALNPVLIAKKLAKTARENAAAALEAAAKVEEEIEDKIGESLPDPLPPALANAGPSGWGEFVIPGLVLGAVAIGGYVVVSRRRRQEKNGGKR